MQIFYRISENDNKRKIRPVYPGQKLKLVELCLKSFLDGFSGIGPKITFIFDNCGEEFTAQISRVIPNTCKIIRISLGNRGSFEHQINLTKESTDEFIYYSEDDYLYLPDAGKKLQEALKFFDFVTLYDHPDRYMTKNPYGEDRQINNRIRLVGKHHWRTVESTCMTFGAKRSLILKNQEIFISLGVTGRKLWYSLIDKRYTLWGAIPSLTTHMEVQFLAPTIDWRKIWEKLI